jgi:hypothetical protein
MLSASRSPLILPNGQILQERYNADDYHDNLHDLAHAGIDRQPLNQV